MTAESERAFEGWQPIETAPHQIIILLCWWDDMIEEWCYECAFASWGKKNSLGHSNRSWHGEATHWMPLPPAPSGQEERK